MSLLTALSLFVCLLNAYVFKGPAFTGRAPSCPHEAFGQYNQFYGKNHSSEAERQLRFWNFLENTKRIEQMNVERPLGPDAWFQHTQFSDMTQAEFKATMNGLKLSQPVTMTQQPRNLTAPTSAINWVEKGKTTAVKNQGACGSCWTFSAVETAESANLMANNQAGAQHGSEQEILDCCHAGGSAGCRGGDPRKAIEWIGQTGGLELNSCYPYRAADGPCESSRCKKAYTVRHVYPIAQNEDAIYNALGKYGPLSIGVDAESWQNYGGGIISGSGCGTQMDHAVQLTGYYPGSGGYWIVRNSWGAGWGHVGFVYLAYGQDVCGIRTYVTAATA